MVLLLAQVQDGSDVNRLGATDSKTFTHKPLVFFTATINAEESRRSSGFTIRHSSGRRNKYHEPYGSHCPG